MPTAEAPAIACTLNLHDMGPRLAWIRQMTDQNLLSHRLDGDVLSLVYRPEAADLVRRVVELERVCCAFLDFALVANEREVRLTISAPTGAGEVAHWLFAQFLPSDATATVRPVPQRGCGCSGACA